MLEEVGGAVAMMSVWASADGSGEEVVMPLQEGARDGGGLGGVARSFKGWVCYDVEERGPAPAWLCSLSGTVSRVFIYF